MFKDPKAVKKALFIARQLAASIDPAFTRVPLPEIGKASGGKIIPHGDPQREANLARHMEGSKAPPVLYHGTSKDADFKKFNVPKNGTWFTTNPKNASDYAMTNDSQGFKLDNGFKYTPTNTSSRVIPVHLSAKNPKVYDPKEHNDLVTSMGGENYKRGQRILYDKLRQAGHDSVRIGDDTWVALGRPNQIKSAIGNRGTFDPNEPDINKASGGEVDDDQNPDLLGNKNAAGAGTQPVFYNKSMEMLRDPNSMNQMKSATPYKWNKELQRYGVKNDELDRYGFDLGSKNKVSRDQVLNLASSVAPRVSEKILGFGSEDNIANNVDLGHSRYETIEPDSSSLSEDANSLLHEDLRHEIKDPNWWPHDQHMNDTVESYLENNVPALDDIEPHRLQKFLDHSVKNGWMYPEEAERLSDNVSKGFAGQKDLNKLLSRVQESVVDGFGDKKTLEHADQPSLFDTASQYKSPKTYDYLKPLEKAVEDVSGAKASVMDHLHEHLSDALQDNYYEMARDNYYENPDSPKRKTVTAYHGHESDNYEIHSTYDGYDVFDNRGRRIGETYNEDEAENLIRNHFAKKIKPHYDKDSTTQEGGGRRRAPAASENPVHQAYSLPGLEDYREHLFKFKPDSGTFDRGHYEPDVLAHARYGTVTDANGKRLLYADEIQSDWHQKALKSGYATKDVVGQIEAAKQKYPEARDQLNRDREHILNSLGVDADVMSSADPLAGLMLLNPDSLTPSQSYAVSDSFHRLQSKERPRLFGRNELSHGEDLPVVAEALRHYQDYAKSALGDNYTDAAMQLNRSLETHNNLEKTINGNLIPDAPWKNASKHGELMLKRLMRIAADHDYDGVALSPGWVQNQRWGDDHRHLYDNIFGNTLKKLAKQNGMSMQQAKLALLEKQAKEPGRWSGKMNKSPYAKAVYFTPEGKQNVKEGFSLFKRGGMVQPYKHTGVIHPARMISGVHIRHETHGTPIFTGGKDGR